MGWVLIARVQARAMVRARELELVIVTNPVFDVGEPAQGVLARGEIHVKVDAVYLPIVSAVLAKSELGA